MDDQLLLRFLTHECNEEELKKIHEWIKLDPANADWLFEIERIWSLKDELAYSAKEDVEYAFKQFINSLPPAENTIMSTANILMLKANNETLVMKDKKIRTIPAWFSYAAAILIISLLTLNLFRSGDEMPIAHHTIEVPKGQRASLTLSDGTKVWLNSESRLTYPTSFAKGERTVNLSGEGYFEVVKNYDVPFIVHSSNLDVKVLGTKFNMKAYQNEETTVKLKEGKIEVSTENASQKIILLPNEQVSYSDKKGFQLLKNADVETADNWRNGELTFVGETLTAIAKSLERKFDKKIIIEDQSLKNELFTSRFKQDVSLKEVLDLLKSTRKINYKIEKDSVFINPN